MRFKTDENLPQSVAKLLKDAKHDVQTILDEGSEDGTMRTFWLPRRAKTVRS